MDHDALRDWSKRAADWAHGYHAGLRERPVRPAVAPGEIAARLPAAAPEAAEPMEAIWADFEALIPDAMTHWQHPRFFAYFPANAAPASMLAEQLANAIAAQCMLWQTAPAATELEQVVTGWLRDALALPGDLAGTIHDSATTATLAAVLTMRERALDWTGNAAGLAGQPALRLYTSAQAHSSVDKAVGGTGIGAFDPIAECIAAAQAAGLPVHVDAAWAGSAMICPEFRHLWAGVEAADSVVINPHKWLGAQFDCSVQFLRDPAAQIRTLGLKPDYLQTPGAEAITDFNDWTLPLGRRFRALKLWFVLRAYGLEGLRTRLRNHVAWAAELAAELARLPGVEIVTPPSLSLFSFALSDGDAATQALLERINAEGRVYLTQTRHAGRFVIRVQVGPFDCTRADVMAVREAVAGA